MNDERPERSVGAFQAVVCVVRVCARWLRNKAVGEVGVLERVSAWQQRGTGRMGHCVTMEAPSIHGVPR